MKKTAIFCSAKNSIPLHQKANVNYKVTCLGCNENYVEKNDRNLVTRLSEHVSCENQPMYQHPSKCEYFSNIIIQLDYQTLMLQQHRSITYNTFSMLLHVSIIFKIPNGPSCYFQKHCTSKILHVIITDSLKPICKRVFVKLLFCGNRTIHKLKIVLSRSNNCFFNVLTMFENCIY